MRQTITEDGISIRYTDAIWFAFLPCLVKVSGGKTSSVDIEIEGEDGTTRNYSADAYNGEAALDFREYVQAYFDGGVDASVDYTQQTSQSKLGKKLSITVNVLSGTNDRIASVSFSTFFIWGALRLGETWNGYKRLTWFRNFPFSFGLYVGGETKVLIGHNNAPNKLVTISLGEGIANVAGSVLPSTAEHSKVYLFEGTIEQATFDNSYDLTFAKVNGTQTELLDIDICDDTEGVYLRWIDRHGFVRYWLFKQGDRTNTVSSSAEFCRDNLLEYPSGRRVSYQREDELALCAPLVGQETFDFLQDLASSPVVDMYIGNDQWQGVTIKVGSYTKTTAVLQDFVCNIVLDNTNIQQL